MPTLDIRMLVRFLDPFVTGLDINIGGSSDFEISFITCIPENAIQITWMVPIIVLGLPIFDTALVFISRT